MSNFVIFSLSRWNEEFGCNIRDISIELAKNHKVLFIDVPLKRKDRLFDSKSNRVKEVEQRAAKGMNIVEVSKNLWHYIDFSVLESVNSIQNSLLFDLINQINNKRFARVIKKATDHLNFDSYILLNDNDVYNGLYLRKYLTPSLYLYYLRDRLSAMKYWQKHVTRLESSLIKQVDVVVANSVYLAESAANINKNSFYIGQGCDVDHFANQPTELHIEGFTDMIKKPIVGYIGALNSERLDIQLILNVVSQLEEFSFVFVGKEDPAFEKCDLHKMNNVFFTGNQDFSTLPKYLYSFDVTINPQLLNDVTIGNYPRKIDEFLAAGKPVVATDTPTMQPFSDHVYLAKTADDYVTFIRQAIAENNIEKQNARKIFASTHNWDNSVKLLLTHCNLK
jgi:teichuronic acid biosynthesis glycosyltransferase TuaH